MQGASKVLLMFSQFTQEKKKISEEKPIRNHFCPLGVSSKGRFAAQYERQLSG